MNDVNDNNIDDAIEQERFRHELDRDKRKWSVRRKMAIGSFGALLTFGIYYSLIGLFVTEIQAKLMAEFNSIVVTVIGALTSLLLGYYGTSYLFDKDKMK